MSVLESEPQADSSNTRGSVYPSTYTAALADVKVGLVGVIEGEAVTVSGGLLSACCSSVECNSYCLERTSADRVIAIVDSERCRRCKRARVDESVKVNSVRFGNSSCFREIFNISLSRADKLAGLLTELTRTADAEGDRGLLQVTVTAPFCAVSNITHLSHKAVRDLLVLDVDFLWGDNLIFNATA